MLLAVLPMCGHHAAPPPSATDTADTATDTADTADTGACVPGAEVCNGVDDDCDGDVDEDPVDGTDVYTDADGDGHGVAPSTLRACSVGAGYSATDDDCDDADASVSPSAAEDCASGVDDDCDGDVDGADGDCGGLGVHTPAEARAELTGYNTLLPLRGDVDGDGLDDLVIGGSGTAYVTAVPPSGVVSVGSSPIAWSEWPDWGAGADVDGDGIAESLTFDVHDWGSPYEIYLALHSGPASGELVSSSPTRVVEIWSLDGWEWADTLGDIDGDGLDDLLLVERGYGETLMWCHTEGCSSGSGDDPHLLGAFEFGTSGDLDGDGYDDVVLADLGGYLSATAVYYSPAVSGWTRGGDVRLDYDDPGGNPRDLRGPGDIDGDGYDDLVVPDQTQASILLGPVADGTLHDQAWASFSGAGMADAADVDGDGSMDLLAGVGADGAVYVVHGVGPGVYDSATADTRWEGSSPGDALGPDMQVLDDQDGDGAADVAVVGAAGVWIFGAM